MSDGLLGCESPWQRMRGGPPHSTTPPSDLPLTRPRPTSYPGSHSMPNQPFLNLSQSDSFAKTEDVESPMLDQSELQKVTSQSVETPIVEDDTQMTSVSEDGLQQSLQCDYCSDDDVDDEIHADFCEASGDPDPCNLQSDTDECNPLTDKDQCNLAYEPDQEEVPHATLDSQTSFSQRSHDQSGDDELVSCDTDDQSKSISVDRDSRTSSAKKSMKNTAV